MNRTWQVCLCCVVFAGFIDRSSADTYDLILISGGSILGVKFLDPLAGLVVSGMILKAGLESGYQR